jgi:Enoyl-(Acyl carrier protein) reductase
MEQSLTQGSAYDALLSRQPINRYGMAEEVAQICVFLASTRASYVTGEEVVVDGGLLREFPLLSVIRPWTSESSLPDAASLHFPLFYRNPTLLAIVTNDTGRIDSV